MKQDIETIKKNQSDIKIEISERNNILEGINNRLDETEEWINDLKDKVKKNPTNAEKQN